MVKIICLISDYLFKVLLIGNSGVGKSCMLMRFSENQFRNHFYNTIGVDFKIKVFQIDRSTVKLQIWDTAGQDRFRTITSSYYRGAQGIIIVFDVTDRESFNQIRQWIQEIDKFAAESVNKILVGNKIDSSQRRVSTDEAEALAKSYNISYIETSAKTNINIENCFSLITRQIIQRVGKPNQNQKSKVGMKLQQNSSQSQQTSNKKGVEQDSQCCMS
ncbi:unnamed protein product (macronuclear) [Paramecium tetraurelia]|uniref:Ras-related protein Rab-1 n=1 Tax=Paramecium tetraurelia TaxID=5888 RepID=A0CQP8_PARTE|nr:uncharacterized protein GSPATT00009463001 [Paramecium tetraurelia]CAK73115.1 unnamed protein product [Paramecium tetraurelia]|eukprot:XP_001440512.1 hypothetical protein (macronuclear) [Paramecium tetraurelia strain d4-2]